MARRRRRDDRDVGGVDDSDHPPSRGANRDGRVADDWVDVTARAVHRLPVNDYLKTLTGHASVEDNPTRRHPAVRRADVASEERTAEGWERLAAEFENSIEVRIPLVLEGYGRRGWRRRRGWGTGR